MLAVASPLVFNDPVLFEEARTHSQFSGILNTMHPYTCRIGVGVIMYDVEHPKHGLVTVYQHVNPGVHQRPFTLETRGDKPWLYGFRTMSGLLCKLK